MARRASLKILGGPLDGRERVLEEAESELRIGADADCHWRVELPGVSPLHARLRREADGGLAVHEAGSPRGVFVNDDPVRGSVRLRHGDILWLGPPGNAQSVMVQCRLASEPAPGSAVETPPAQKSTSLGQTAFEVEKTVDVAPGPASEADEFFIAEPEEAPPTPSPQAPSPAPRSAAGPPAIPSRTAAPPTPPPVPAPSAPPVPSARPGAPGKASRPAAPPPPSGTAMRPSAGSARPAAQPVSSPVAQARPEAPGRPAATPARSPRPASPVPATPSGARRSARRAPLRLAPVAALAGGALLLGGGFGAWRLLSAPRLDGVSPERVGVGQIVTLTGRHFAAEGGANRVFFGDRAGQVVQASADRLEVEVPELPTRIGQDVTFPVRVEVGGRATPTIDVTVFQTPRIHGLSPDVAMPGDELTLAGTGWGPGVSVSFAGLAAEILQVTPTLLRVRVPALEGTSGTSMPVVVTMAGQRSNGAPFVIGRLPLLLAVEPPTAAPGDMVTLQGRGFELEPYGNSVRLGGVPALVVASNAGELQVMVPWAPAGGVQAELRVPSSEGVAQAALSVAAAADPVQWRFLAEPFDDAAGHNHAFVSSALGPLLIVSSAEGRSAAERALQAARRLNEAGVPLRASLDAEFEARGARVHLVGINAPLLEATAEDASAYNEDWTGLRGRGGPVTPERLALWWVALARDLRLLVVRGERPVHTAEIGAEGRILGDVFQAARRTGRFGLPRQVVEQLTAPQRRALLVLAQRVPASLVGPTRSASGAAGGATPLRLQGNWSGFETEGGARKLISVSFARGGGTLTFTGGVSIGVPLLSVETAQRNAARFSAQVRGGIRYYDGSWDGERLRGRISTDAAGRNVVGSFELLPGP